MKAAQFWNIDNVRSFRGFDVVDSEIIMTDEEWCDVLNDQYGDVEVCGMTFSQGDLLKDVDPTAFRCGKSDEESNIQSELEDQLSREIADDVEFIDDLEEEEDEE